MPRVAIEVYMEKDGGPSHEGPFTKHPCQTQTKKFIRSVFNSVEGLLPREDSISNGAQSTPIISNALFLILLLRGLSSSAMADCFFASSSFPFLRYASANDR